MLSRSELRQIQTAIRQKWPITDEKRQECIEECEKILADPDRPDRHRKTAQQTLSMLRGEGVLPCLGH